MTKSKLVVLVVFCMFASTLCSTKLLAQSQSDDHLLQVREKVWRAWFAGDIPTLRVLVPPETIVMSSGEENWMHQAEVLQGATEFHDQGGKLIRLEFPRTEIQHFGDVAIIWSDFILETDVNGKRSSSEGRASEIFVKKNGEWTNPGWYTNSTKKKPE